MVVDDASLGAVTASVERCPLASTALALLLRGSQRRSVGEGLVAESAAYSMLQAGPEFARWRRERASRPHHHDDDGPSVRVERDGGRLGITLARPRLHNAFSSKMRDELHDALLVAAADPSVVSVELAGDGPSFCSGGDLEEFGSRPDPATAHLVRLQRSVGRVIAAMADRVAVRLHGACFGAGIELAAFAGRVVAAPDTRIALPEVALGLIPGAGGTVSVTGRIGRHRAALLALGGAPVHSELALAWGLVDAIEER